MKHRTYALLLAATLSVSLLAGCGSSNGANSSQSSDNSSISSSQGKMCIRDSPGAPPEYRRPDPAQRSSAARRNRSGRRDQSRCRAG